MSGQERDYLPEGLTRAQRVSILEQGFQKLGDSDSASFQRAIVYERLMEGGLSIQHAAMFEEIIAHEQHQQLANGLDALKEKREAETT
jgi:hypothetical protein